MNDDNVGSVCVLYEKDMIDPISDFPVLFEEAPKRKALPRRSNKKKLAKLKIDKAQLKREKKEREERAKSLFMKLSDDEKRKTIRYAKKYGDKEAFERLIEDDERKEKLRRYEFECMINFHYYDDNNPEDVKALARCVFGAEEVLSPRERALERYAAEGKLSAFKNGLTPDDTWERYQDAQRLEHDIDIRYFEMDDYHKFLKKWCKKRKIKKLRDLVAPRRAFRQRHMKKVSGKGKKKDKRVTGTPLWLHDTEELMAYYKRTDEYVIRENARRAEMREFLLEQDLPGYDILAERFEKLKGKSVEDSDDEFIKGVRKQMKSYGEPPEDVYDYDSTPDRKSEYGELNMTVKPFEPDLASFGHVEVGQETREYAIAASIDPFERRGLGFEITPELLMTGILKI